MRRLWGRAFAALYDRMLAATEEAGLREQRRALVSQARGRVLEVGAGTGLNLPYYERTARVVAVEPDEGMADRLPARIAEAKVPVEVVAASAESLPFEDGRFDAAVLTFVLCSIPEPVEALREIRRVLRPGGRLVVLEHVRGDGRVGRWQDRLTPLQRKLAGNCHLNRETLDAIGAAGFDAVEVARTMLPGTHALVRPGIQGVAIKTSS